MQFIKRSMRWVVWRAFQFLRVHFFSLVSTNCNINGTPLRHQPVLLSGTGKIIFSQNVKFGVKQSPSFLNSYAYIEAREKDAIITFGARSWFNNGFVVIAEACEISIGEDCLVGNDVTIYDSDFHALSPSDRLANMVFPKQSSVNIGDNVFIGSHCIILKGTNIGNGCVVAAGSVVNGSFPATMLIGGNPAKVIRAL